MKTDQNIAFFITMPKILLGLSYVADRGDEDLLHHRLLCSIPRPPGLSRHWKADQLLLGKNKQPNYLDFTLTSLENALLVFLGGMFLKSLVVFGVKTWISEDISGAGWRSKLVHIVEVLNMPGAETEFQI